MTYEQKSAIIISQLRADRDRLLDALDKIRTEIERHRRKTQGIDTYDLVGDCLDIIDKYKVESEDKNEDDSHDFKVGDEIVFKKNGIYHEGKVGVIYKVLYDSEDNIYYLIRFPDGTFATHDGSNIKKTGKTYPYSPY
jgi:hypothetical protein